MGNSYPHISVTYDEQYRAGWVGMCAEPVPCFSRPLLTSLLAYFDDVRACAHRYDYIVGTSAVPGVFNLGGDLQLFSRAIAGRDRGTLEAYAADCIKVLHAFMGHLDCALTTINLVEGDALGGGFEAALSANVLVAERGVRMGLPEVVFNLFPGMGAYSVLSRKIGAAAAEKMIFGGTLYTAEQLYEMGVVDILAEKGGGRQAVVQYMERAAKSPNTYRAMRKVKDYCHQVPYRELAAITEIWVDAALALGERDLQMMAHLLRKQGVKFAG